MKNKLVLTVGLDITDYLNVKKYEPPIPANLHGKIKGLFPSFLIKTDEERIQNLSDYYEEYKKFNFYVTEKIDGTSFTAYYNGEFGVCSRNLEKIKPDNLEDDIYWKVADQLNIENILKDHYNKTKQYISLQGELIGEGIQKNIYNIKGHKILFFNVYDITNKEFFDMGSFIKFMKNYKLEHVPIIHTNFILPNTINELLEYANGKSILNNKINREGLVIRSIDRRISFKVISNQFLLKHE